MLSQAAERFNSEKKLTGLQQVKQMYVCNKLKSPSITVKEVAKQIYSRLIQSHVQN